MYKVDLLVGPREEGDQRTMLESYVRTATEIGKMSDVEFFSKFGEASRVLRHVGGTADEAGTKIWDLHRRHAQRVLDVLDGSIRDHATEIREGKLPDSCLVILALPERYKKTGAPTASDFTFKKQGQFWTVAYAGKTLFLQDSVGVAYLAHLLSNPGQDVAATQLRAVIAGQDEDLAVGSSDEILDRKAVQEYKAELEDLKEQLVEAEANNDLGKKSSIQEQLVAIQDQLKTGTGLGGRLRKVPSDVERARQAVSVAIARTMKIIEKDHPPLWRHLKNALELGTHCSYSPDGTPTWQT
jgi:hypothetical protein